MDLETLLTGTKWEILELLSEKKYSPMELAKKLSTTIANISQQLRLLQTAGIVNREKTATAGAGKPRTLFSISHDFGFISIITDGFAGKKLIKLAPEQKRLLKQWIK
jgi:predicted ArsR family transcriptional regulator